MNTRKQVLIMSALLMMMLIAVAVYAAWYPYRATNAEEHFEEARAERASILFARNCRTCHGDVGEGGVLGGRLPAAPPLNRSDLQGFEDSGAEVAAEVNLTATTVEVDDGAAVGPGAIILIDEERMRVRSVEGNTLTVERAIAHTEAAGHFPGASVNVFDEDILEETIDLITNTISCGRVGTAMPAWAQDQGSSLSDEQIMQLAVLITTARWDLAESHAEEEDRAALGVLLTAPVSDDATEISVDNVTRFTVDNAIRIGEERLRVTALPDFPATATNVPGNVTVERAILGSTAAEHSAGDIVYAFPEAPDPPSINEQSCGQIAQAPAPTGTPGLIEDFGGDQTVEVTASGISFDTDEISIQSDGDVRIRFTNNDPEPHNIGFYVSETDDSPVSDGSVGVTFEGPNVQDDTVFEIPDAGEYFFRCDVHPTIMTGTFLVE
jgi:plastocyanin/mono/diheme cytochrome c family protein